MKNNKGITLTSLVIYIIGLVVLVGTMATLTRYFYNNLDQTTLENKVSKEYTEFTNYITNDINSNKIENVFIREEGKEVLIKFIDYSSHKYTFTEDSIYYVEIKDNQELKRVRLSKDVDNVNSLFSLNSKVLGVKVHFKNGIVYNASYTIK